MVRRLGKYGRKASWIVIRYGKYRRKLWNDMEIMEETQVEYRKYLEKYGIKACRIVKWYGK
jgi:hypothetical protein